MPRLPQGLNNRFSRGQLTTAICLLLMGGMWETDQSRKKEPEEKITSRCDVLESLFYQ